jgi:hypothetical protein
MFFGTTGADTGQAVSRGRIANSTGTPIMYPSPFFDMGHTYLPKSLGELFRWCKYYFLTNPVIHAIITKLATYPITDLVIEEEDKDLRQMWEDFLQNVLHYRQFQLDVGLDYHCYGNAFISIVFPFTKAITCLKCNHKEPIKQADYKFQEFEFILKACNNCGQSGKAKVEDNYIKVGREIRLIRWNPEHMEVEVNKITGEAVYYFRPPNTFYNDLLVGRPHIVEKTPQLFIDAAKNKKAVSVAADKLFHLKRSSISSEYEGWGTPRILAVLKDAFYMQLMKKTTEVLLAEHCVPLRVLFPQSSTPAVNPYTATNLANWKSEIGREINRFRLDPNYIPILPLPLGYQAIGGDGKGLLLIGELRNMYEMLASGMGVPIEFLFGGLSFSGTSVSMRMLENDFLRFVEQQKSLLNWVVDQISTHLEWKEVKATFKPFKMADDLARLAQYMQLNQFGKLSDHSLLSYSGFDAEAEQKLLEQEAVSRVNATKKQRLAEVKVQGEAQKVLQEYQIEAQEKAQKAQAKLQQELMSQQQQQGMQQQGGPAPAMQSQLAPNPAMLGPGGEPAAAVGVDLVGLAQRIAGDIQANPEQSADILQRLQAQSPELHSLVMGYINPGEGHEALPEHRAPRRGPDKAMI